MSKVTDARIAAIKALFKTGDKLTEENFADLVDAIQEAAEDHEHVSGGGAGSGTGNAAPIKIWKTFVFCVPGDLEVGTRVAPSLFADADMDIDHVYGYVQTESYESAIIVDVDKNGTTIFTDQGQRIWMFGTDWDSNVPAVTALIKGDRLDIDIDQVGNETPGANLTILVICKQDAVS